MRSNMGAKQEAQRVGNTTRNAATSPAMRTFARVGYAMRGVLYIVIGILAVQLAVGHSSKAADQQGALQIISQQPFGKFLLVVVAIGLLAYGLWSLIQAVFDTEGKGKKAKGIVSRLGYAGIGVSYLVLAFGTFQLIMGSGSGTKGSNASTQGWTARLLHFPFGQFLVALVGLIVLAIAGYMFYKAYSAKFQQQLDLSSVSASLKKGLIFLGRFGYGAFGVVFTIIGIFLIVAAIHGNSSQAKGLDGALLVLSQQPFGQVLLIIVAIGLIAYGAYSFVEARYRRIG